MSSYVVMCNVSIGTELAEDVIVTVRAMLLITTLLTVLFVLPVYGGEPVVELTGTDLIGGAADLFGSIKYGEIDVNYVYAQPTGNRSTMSAKFTISKPVTEEVVLYVKGRDDDYKEKCGISIELNGATIFSGPSKFPDAKWETQTYPVSRDLLKTGDNEIKITCTEKDGNLGRPPWFMVAKVAIAETGHVFRRNILKDFWFNLPAQIREYPEPLPAGKKPGFAWRGTKGWLWTPEQYLAEIPVMAKYKMNFLMNCYGSMCDIENYSWGNPEVNRWWEDLPAPKKSAYENIVRQCEKNGIAFCFSMNPNLFSKRPLQYDSMADIDQLWKHYSWMQGLGVKWFNISLDDISQGIDASGQAKVVNEIFKRLRANDPSAQMIFTPTAYWGDGTDAEARPYLEKLAKELDKDVYLFWTGNSVVGNVNRQAAVSYKGISKHRLFLWDNYPVNDGHPTLHLGPLVNRDPDLCEVVDGYMGNPLYTQNEVNRIPLLTCADYAYNPYNYDPERSIQQAILHLESAPEKRDLLRELVEVYPGFIILGKPNTGLNPVRENFSKLVALKHSRPILEGYIRYLEDLSARMGKAFPDKYKAAQKTLADDVSLMKGMARDRYLAE